MSTNNFFVTRVRDHNGKSEWWLRDHSTVDTLDDPIERFDDPCDAMAECDERNGTMTQHHDQVRVDRQAMERNRDSMLQLLNGMRHHIDLMTTALDGPINIDERVPDWSRGIALDAMTVQCMHRDHMALRQRIQNAEWLNEEFDNARITDSNNTIL